MHRFTIVGVHGAIIMSGALSCAEHAPTGVGGSPDPRVTLGPVLLVPGETTSVSALLPDADP